VLAPPLNIVEWRTVTGDLALSKEKVFKGNLAFGFETGTWRGRGALTVIPAGFGIDILLGGLNERGAMIGIDVDLPVPIPLGPTGLGLAGLGGDFAYNFKPRLEKDGVPIPSPTAEDYVRWAKEAEPIDRWISAPIDQTAVGIGIRADLVTAFDNGYAFKLEPVGFAVLTPGPVFIMGGTGKLLDTSCIKAEGIIVVDIHSASFAFGLAVSAGLTIPGCESPTPEKDKAILLTASGKLDAFFSFSNPSTWYVNFGRKGEEIKSGKFLISIIQAQFYLMLNNNRIAFGVGLSYGYELKWSIIRLTAKIGGKVEAEIGWNPVELEGMVEIWGELGLKVWKFGFLLRLAAEARGHTPSPHQLKFKISYNLNLPWPIPDVKGSKTLLIGDEDPEPPVLTAPLMLDDNLQVGGLHALTGRQWVLDDEAVWPDAELVIPFSTKTLDATGKVGNAPTSGTIEGGYLVEHTLNTLELINLTEGTPGVPVTNLQAVWGAVDDTMARLHVNASDPFSWLVPHVDLVDHAKKTPAKCYYQHFGTGPEEAIAAPRRFGHLIVDPVNTPVRLTPLFKPIVGTRVMRLLTVTIRLRTLTNSPILTQVVTLYLIGIEGTNFQIDGAVQSDYTSFGTTSGVHLIAVTFKFPGPVDEFVITHGGGVVGGSDITEWLYAIGYCLPEKNDCNWQEKLILQPGRYELRLTGRSEAAHPDTSLKLPDADIVDWSVTQAFDVTAPESLRPYIVETTLGDSRLFGEEGLPWNPTIYGFGFPAYQHYRPGVLFKVPYLGDIFPQLVLQVRYETGTVMEQIITPTANSGGASFLPQASQQWITDHCGTLSLDSQVVLTDPYPEHGPAAVRLLYDHPNGTRLKLDDWTAYVSQFNTFKQHVAWPNHCLKVIYTAAGRSELACCPVPKAVADSFKAAKKPGLPGNHIDKVTVPFAQAGTLPDWITTIPLLFNDYPLIGNNFPTELSIPPVSWRLPASMNTHVDALAANTGVKYARFAAASGVRVNTDGLIDALSGLNNTVSETTVEALVDPQGRPYALWLRTPEPVDWRRVTASLTIRHVTPNAGCPTGYAERHALHLDIVFVPSPDASAAFLIGVFKGYRIRLPRGEYKLTLNFDAHAADLPRLHPAPVVGGSVESHVLKFVQTSGLTWPLPPSDDVLPANILELLVKIYKIAPNVLDELVKPQPDPVLIAEWIAQPPIDRLPQVLPADLADTDALLLNAVGRVEASIEMLANTFSQAQFDTLEGYLTDIIARLEDRRPPPQPPPSRPPSPPPAPPPSGPRYQARSEEDEA